MHKLTDGYPVILVVETGLKTLNVHIKADSSYPADIQYRGGGKADIDS